MYHLVHVALSLHGQQATIYEKKTNQIHSVTADKGLAARVCGGKHVAAPLPIAMATFRIVEVPFTQPEQVEAVLPTALQERLALTSQHVIASITVGVTPVSTQRLVAAVDEGQWIAWLDTYRQQDIDPESVRLPGIGLWSSLTRQITEDMHHGLLYCDDSGSLLICGTKQLRDVLPLPPLPIDPTAQQEWVGTVQRGIMEVSLRHGEPLTRVVAIGPRLQSDVDLAWKDSIDHLTVMTDTTQNALSGLLSISHDEVPQFEFRQENYRASHTVARHRRRRRTGLFSISLVLAAGLAWGGTTWWENEAQLAELRGETTHVFLSILPHSKPVQPVDQLRDAISALHDQSARWTVPPARPSTTLQALVPAFPKTLDLTLRHLEITGTFIMMEGDVPTFQDLHRLQDAIKRLPTFQGVVFSDTQPMPSQRIQFRVQAKVIEGRAS